ncbi:hypothetical protein LOTGIDRAFT_133818, partial [Lottia gigantea]
NHTFYCIKIILFTALKSYFLQHSNHTFYSIQIIHFTVLNHTFYHVKSYSLLFFTMLKS